MFCLFVCLFVCGVGNMTLTIVMWWSLVIFCACALKVGVVSVVCVVWATHACCFRHQVAGFTALDAGLDDN